MSPSRRVLLIGLDAADVDFIEATAGNLPNLRRALAEGRRFDLDSTTDVLTGSVWPTFYTGTLPGEHGIYHPIQWDPSTMRARRVSDDWLYREPFWCELERRGETVVALDVPFSFPGRLERGIEVNNWGTHEQLGSFSSTRPEIAREISRRFGAHPMGHDTPVPRSVVHTEALTQRLANGARAKGRIARWLMESVDWSVFLVVFGEAHRGGHQLWPEPGYAPYAAPPGSLLAVYRAVDAAVGDVLEGVDPATTAVVVFALHGMETNRSQGHFARAVLDRIHAAVEPGASTRPAPGGGGGFVPTLRRAIPGPVQHAIARATPIRVLDWLSDREVTSGVDWSRTPGFTLRPDLHGYVRLNLTGREAAGSLEPGGERHGRYVDAVRRGFLSLTEAGSGRRIARDVLAMSEVFPGARSAFLPDLVVRWEALPQATEIRSEALGSFSARPDNGRCGEHRARGFATLLGSGRDAALPPLAHGKDFPAFVRGLLG